jgi:adenylate cyclase
MDAGAAAEVGRWLVGRGLAGLSEIDLLNAFCERCRAGGLDLARGIAVVDTLHPIHEGRVFRWRAARPDDEPVFEYGSTAQGHNAEQWRRSPFYRLVTTGESELRRRIARGDPRDFPILDDLAAEGQTDYVAFVHRFDGEGVIGEMDCVYSAWSTSHPRGFDDGDAAALRQLVPVLALAIKCASLARIARTLVEVYLGRDAGRRVLEGRISRGVAERINAVVWYSDLRGYTSISDAASPDEIIPLLNDYADVVISAIRAEGGDVLKLIGDGVLAIFAADRPAAACEAALEARARVLRGLVALNDERAAQGRPVTSVYLGLHIGEVFFGNIGSRDRLDFTVVGPAVNETSRIAAMCRSADRSMLVSSEFAAAAAPADRARLVSVGRYALRGVGRAQELFTLDPGAVGPV